MHSVFALLALLAVCTSGVAPAAGYPDKPVRLIVPFVAGGSYDTVARIIAQPLAESFHQQIVVDNRPGASGSIGANLVAKAAPDGYTLGMFGNNQLITSAVNEHLPYNLLVDFAPVMRVAKLDMVIVVNPQLPVRSLQELIALLKEHPGKYFYGSGGVAGAPHLATEQFKALTGINVVHVPYKGGGVAVTGLVSNEVQMMMLNMISVEPQVKAGRLRALAIAAKSRSALMPEVPTTAEAGFPGYVAAQWYGIVAPAHLPPIVLQKLSAQLIQIAALPSVRAKLAKQGADVMIESPPEFAAYLNQATAGIRKIAIAAGVHAD
ncbi:MAG: tripartite tricarboxylate transporter substrate binding protein [Burkholderiales bacterium]